MTGRMLQGRALVWARTRIESTIIARSTNDPLQTRHLHSLHSCLGWNASHPMLTQRYPQQQRYAPLPTKVRLFPCYHLSTTASSGLGDDDEETLKMLREANSKSGKTKKLTKKQRRKHKKNWERSQRFIDQIRLQVTGGTGGKGCLSHHQIDYKLKPDGGHGGAGGSVILVAHNKVQSLQMSKKHFSGDPGAAGQSKERMGASSSNTIVRVPCGVVVKRILDYDEEWDEEKKRVINLADSAAKDGEDPSHKLDLGYLRGIEENELYEANGKYFWRRDPNEENREQEEEGGGEDSDEDSDDDEYQDGDEEEQEEEEDDFDPNINQQQIFTGADSKEEGDDIDGLLAPGVDDRTRIVLADLDEHGSYVVVAKGGRGGLGTKAYSKLRNAEPVDPFVMARNAAPELGEAAHLELELKMIADIGLVGFPNAGKSSLLRAMSLATPKVAPYPFTTLHPLMGVIEYRDAYKLRVADIPGLIAGAAEGRGCGHAFLRHVERTKALVYIVDAAGTDGRDPHDDLMILAEELMSYGEGDMVNRRAIVMANKTDLLSPSRVPDLLNSLAELSDEIGIRRDHDVFGVSAGVTGDGLGKLSKAMREIVVKVEEDRALAAAAEAEIEAQMESKYRSGKSW